VILVEEKALTNPFECGTLAHGAWESMTGESNCDKKKEEPTRPRKHRQPITIPDWKSFEDFKKACGSA